MNHYHSWSWPSAFPSPRSHFLVYKTRSHRPESLEVPLDSWEVGGGGAATPSGQRWGRESQGAWGPPVPAKDIGLFLTGPKTGPVPEIPPSAIPPSD